MYGKIIQKDKHKQVNAPFQNAEWFEWMNFCKYCFIRWVVYVLYTNGYNKIKLKCFVMNNEVFEETLDMTWRDSSECNNSFIGNIF